MLILALDTTSRVASAALCRDGEIIGYGEKDSQMNHSRTILPVVQHLLEQNGLALSGVDVFAATVGPGSFTGVRIGVAAIKGYAMALNKPCAAVSTLESAAWAAKDKKGILCAGVQARQDEFFYAFFENDGEIRRKSADQVGKAQEILRQMEECTGLLWITGDGGGFLMEYAEKAGLSPLLAEGCRQNAAATALRAFQMAERGELTDCHHLTPSYLRLSQAERMKLQNK